MAVLERRRQRSTHSRSIGVHPPALEVAARLGLAEPFVTRGVRVERGHAYAGSTRLGTLSFRSCPPPYRFVLTLPQAEGERLLERRLASLPSGELCRGVEVVALERAEANVRLRFADGGALEAALVVGCDGHDSAVRGWLRLPFDERRYPDRFMMGDFPDDTRLGPTQPSTSPPAGWWSRSPCRTVCGAGWRRSGHLRPAPRTAGRDA